MTQAKKLGLVERATKPNDARCAGQHCAARPPNAGTSSAIREVDGDLVGAQRGFMQGFRQRRMCMDGALEVFGAG